MVQAQQIVGHPVRTAASAAGSNKRETSADEPPPRVTKLCCLSYVILLFSAAELLQASVSVALKHGAGGWLPVVPDDRYIRAIRIFDMVNCFTIPFAILLLCREIKRLRPLLRGCEVCRCPCRCAFLPVSLAALSSSCFVLQLIIYVDEYGVRDLDILRASLAWLFMLSLLSTLWIITLCKSGQRVCL